jgi:hypothetical protein
VYRQAKNALVQFRLNQELLNIEETDQEEKEDILKRVVTNRKQLSLSQSDFGVRIAALPPQAFGAGSAQF